MHILSHGEQVDAFPCPINKVSKLEQKLEMHAAHLEPRLDRWRQRWRRHRWRRSTFWKGVLRSSFWKGATANQPTPKVVRA